MGKLLDTFKSFFHEELRKQSNPLEKSALMSLGGFEAPVWTRDRSQIWMADQESTVNPNAFTRNEVVRLTRYLVNNAPLFERILTVVETYAIGGALIANAVTLDPAFNTANTSAFDNWASSCFCFANNLYNFYEAQKLIARELIIAGEVFIVLIKSPDTNYPQLMLLPTENVRNSGDVGDDSIDGLFVDPFGKVTAYMVFLGGTYQKIDASNVIHLMRHKNIGQLRGIGSFAASLNSMRDYKDMQVLEKRALKVHSSLAAVVEKKSGEAGAGIFGGVVPSDGLGNPLLPEQRGRVTTNDGLERAFGGNVVCVEPGEKVNLVTSNRSTDGFFHFLEMLLRDVCQNISLPYEFLVNADKLTGVGVRFILSDAAFFFGHLQNMIIDGAINRIYSWVTASFINSKRVLAPVGDLPWAVSFTKPMSITIDPTRISNAEISLLGNSMSNYEGFWSARGKDWRKELAQHAQEEAYLDELSKEYNVPIGRLRNLPVGSTLLPGVRETVMENPTQEEDEQKEDATGE